MHLLLTILNITRRNLNTSADSNREKFELNLSLSALDNDNKMTPRHHVSAFIFPISSLIRLLDRDISKYFQRNMPPF